MTTTKSKSTEAIAEGLGKLVAKVSGETMPIEAAELMGALIERNAQDLHYVTDQLMESYKHDAEDARATISAIRDGVGSLLEGPYMPTPSALIGALYPSAKIVDLYREAEAS